MNKSSEMMGFGVKKWKQLMKCSGKVKRISHDQKQLCEDGNKLESRILKRMEQDLRETLLRSSNVDNGDEKHHFELLRHSGMKNRKLEPTVIRI